MFWRLTHWGRVTHICVSEVTIICSDNGLAPTNTGILLIWPLATNFSEISVEIHIFSLKKMDMQMSPSKCRPLCLGLSVITFNKLLPEPNMTKFIDAYIRQRTTACYIRAFLRAVLTQMKWRPCRVMCSLPYIRGCVRRDSSHISGGYLHLIH